MATDIEYTAGKAAGGAVRGGALGAITGLFSGLGLGMIGGLANPAGIVLGIAGLAVATLTPATGIGIAIALAMPAIGGIMGAASGLAIGTGAGAGLGGVTGAMAGNERSAERTAQYELFKQKIKGSRQNEIDAAQAAAVEQIGTQLYLQGRSDQAQLDQQEMTKKVETAVEMEHANKFVGSKCCPRTEPFKHEDLVKAIASGPQVPGQ